MQASEVGAQWLSGRMLDMNSRGHYCKPQRWGGGRNGSVVECSSLTKKVVSASLRGGGAMAQW